MSNAMLDAIRRWRDETDETYLLGVVRIVVGLLLVGSVVRAASDLRSGYFGEVFHWPILSESLVPAKPLYGAIVVTEGLLATLVVTGIQARPALLASALIGTYVLLCDRLQFHHNRFALLCFSFLLAFAPCDRSLSLAGSAGPRTGPLWAARLAQLQVSMIYVASGGSKLLDPDWRGGKVVLERLVLSAQQAVDRGVPSRVLGWLCEPGVASALSKLGIMTELLLSVALWLPWARVFALWWGVWFHLTIEATSRVEGFTWLTLAVYVLFATPEVNTRKIVYDAGRPRARAVARAVARLDWLKRFDVKAWPPDGVRRGHGLVVVRRDGTHATGIHALVMIARCTPIFFPLWAPLAAAATLTSKHAPSPPGR
jgi:hypothetical protein